MLACEGRVQGLIAFSSFGFTHAALSLTVLRPLCCEKLTGAQSRKGKQKLKPLRTRNQRENVKA